MTGEERDKVIRILQWLHDNKFLFRSTEEDVKYATELAIQVLEQESSGVLISCVKHAIYKVCLCEGNKDIFIKILNEINKLPFANLQLCDDAISRQDAIKAIDEKAKRIKNEDTLNGLAGAVGILFDLPPVKPQEKTGHWIIIDDCEHFMAKCSECGEVVDSRMINDYPYCHCGAKMVEG